MFEEDKNGDNDAVLNFQAITEARDPAIAIQYLTSHGWDVSKAAEQYFTDQEMKRLTSSREQMYIPMEGYSLDNERGDFLEYMRMEREERDEDNFMKVAFRFIKRLFMKSISKEPENKGPMQFGKLLATKFPRIKQRPKFTSRNAHDAIAIATQRRKPLLVFLYDQTKSEPLLPQFLENTICNPDIIKTLNDNFIVFGADTSSEEGKQAVTLLEPAKIPHISLRLIQHGNSTHTFAEDLEVTKERFTEGLTDTILNYEQLHETYRTEEEHPVDPKVLEDRLLKEMQEQEFLEAKRIDEERRKAELEAEQKKIEEEERERVEEERRIKEKEESLTKKRSTIPPEPEAGEEGVCEIAFRFPSGKRVIRKFLKTIPIQILYNYVDCLNEEDAPEGKYELSQPMPKKAYKNMEATLESEGLYPKALIQIGVIDQW